MPQELERIGAGGRAGVSGGWSGNIPVAGEEEEDDELYFLDEDEEEDDEVFDDEEEYDDYEEFDDEDEVDEDLEADDEEDL